MEVLGYFFNGLIVCFEPFNLLMMLVGLFVGIIGGMLPGISTVTAIALFIPFTFTMEAAPALISLGAVFAGATYGGANASILINTPGQPGSFATTLDGYQMTKKGKAEEALYAALWGSVYGGIFGGLCLLCFFKPLSAVALKFGSESFFWLAIFGLTTIASLFPGNLFKGLLGGVIGLAIGTVGLDVTTGTPRFCFGYFPLIQGLDMVIILIALFSFCQMLVLLEDKNQFIASFQHDSGAFWRPFFRMFKRTKMMILSSVIGTLVGILPGAGSNIASIMAYNEAQRWDKHPERFGTGEVDGVLAPECSNNASVGGALVPLMSLGIPGSAAAAVLVAGLVAQGLQPGPTMMEKNADIAFAFIAAMIVVNLGIIPVGYVLARLSSKILVVPKLYIIPSVLALSFIGAYALRNSSFDIVVMVIGGIASYIFLKAKIPPAAIALGLVLSTMIEESLGTTIMRAQALDSVWDLLIFSPMAFCLFALNVVVVLIPFIRNRGKCECKPYAFSMRNFLRFDFWTIAGLLILNLVFLNETANIKGIAQVFPKGIFLVMLVLNIIIMLSILFAPEDELGSSRMTHVGRTFTFNAVFYSIACLLALPLIDVLGFYTTMALMMMVMLLFSRRSAGLPFNGKTLGKFVLVTLVVIAAQWACFNEILNVATPAGMFNLI